MIDVNGFKEWLINNTEYSTAVISDTISRVKRADKILPWYDDEVYIFRLEQLDEYKKISCSVRSQIKRSVKWYFSYIKSKRDLH
ncbi:MAG: hypothetical protein PHC56_05810 [Herbinix sp.]|nr:hypothetical protein [Herbinix sp.]